MRFPSLPGVVLLPLLACGAVAAVRAEDPAEAAHREGVQALHAGDPAAAVEAFERATRLEPTEAQHWVRLGMARGQLNRWDAAIEAYDKAIELEPAATTYNNLANIYFRRGDYESAAEHYGRALEIDPDYLLASFHYGWCLRQLNRPQEAERAFANCLRIEPHTDRERQTRVDCLFGLGSMRHRAEDYAASARMMEQVLEVNPGHPEARYYLGMAYRHLGRIEDARRQLAIHAEIMAARHPDVPIEKPDDE